MAVTGVKLSDKEIELIEGQTHNLTATVLPENATNKNVTWTSGVPEVATVSDDGTVVAMAMGASTITVRTVDGGYTANCAVIVKMRVIPVESISLNYDKIGIEEGSGVYLSATVLPSNATNKNVIWSASPENVISVDNIGKVTGLIPGEGDVTATTEDGGFTATCHIIVNAVTVNAESVTLDKETLELTEGETAVLTATVLPENTTDKTLEWRTSDENVATVDQEGKVTAVSAGKTVITASCGAAGASCEVTVKKVEVTGLTIEPASVTLSEGKTIQLSATVSPANADQTVEWASQRPDIATVDRESGLVTAVSEGETKIYARSLAFTDVSAACEVTVIKDPTLRGISINPAELNLTVGQAQTLQVLYTPEYAANKNVSWKSSDDAVASVSADGKVTAKTEGTATVTATSEEGGFTANCKVTVSKTAGVRVYYYASPALLYVNGQLDPLSGAYDKEHFRFDYVSKMCSDGSDLYSLEAFYNDWDCEYMYYLCKNREPLFKVDRNKPSDDLRCMSARGGKTAAVFGANRYNNYLVIVNPDGTKTSSSIPCDFRIDDISCAVSPSGDVYIAANYQDSFDTYHLVVYKYSPDGNWSESKLNKDSSYAGYVQVSDGGDVYVLTTIAQVDGYHAVLYKNQEGPSELYYSKHYIQSQFSVTGGHVHSAVIEFGDTANTITEMRDGNVVRTFSTSVEDQFGVLEGLLAVTSSGDSYVATNFHIYKNGNLLYTVPDGWLRGFCVVE